MEKRYFIPLSAFSFPEFASAEAISPTDRDVAGAFLNRNSRTKTSGEDIPVNPCGSFQVLYSSPVSWKYKEGSLMDYPLVVDVAEKLIDETYLVPLNLPSLPTGISAWAYSKTIFCSSADGIRYLFRSEDERKQSLQRLSPFLEAKSIRTVKQSAELLSSNDPVVILSDEIKNEILQEIKKIEDKASDSRKECLLNEVMAGACLGYDIARFENLSRDKRADKILDGIHDPSIHDDAEKCMRSIEEKNKLLSIMEKIVSFSSNIQNLEQILRETKRQLKELQSEKLSLEGDRLRRMRDFAALATKGGDIDWRVDEAVSRNDWSSADGFKAYYRYGGRSVIDRWDEMDPILKGCIDFIVKYPSNEWNWFGNKERMAFLVKLWKAVVKPNLEGRDDNAIGKMLDEVTKVCNYFNNPNGKRPEVSDIKSKLIQALYVALLCEGKWEELRELMRNAKCRDYCLALYGAFKGYAYFPRKLLPEIAHQISSPVEEPTAIDVVHGDSEVNRQPQSLKQRILSKLDTMFKGGKGKSKLSKRAAAEKVLGEFADGEITVDGYLGRLSKEDGWKPSGKLYRQLSDDLKTDTLFGNSTK